LITQWTFFVIILVINAILAAIIAILLGRKHKAPGRNAMIWMLAGLAVWAFGYAMNTTAATLATKIFWLRLQNIGILTVPAFWLLFTVQYAQVDKWLNRKTGALFFIIPVIALVFIFSERWFYLYYSSIRPLSEIGGPLVIERGPFYLVAAIQAYLFNLTGTGILIWRFVYYRNIYRKQLLILIGAVLIPLIVNIFYQFAPRIIPSFSLPFDLTPISFTITAFLLSAGVFGLRLFDLIPIARHTVLEHIPEMVFVVDAHDRVLDANSVAQKMLGKPLDEIIGKDPLEVFSAWPQLINRFLTADESHEEIQIPGDPPRTLDLNVSALYNQLNQLEGRVIVAHDVTERKWLEDDLKYAN
jgi:PAS domain S-box-containing protein